MDNFSDYNSNSSQYDFGAAKKSVTRRFLEFIWEMTKITLISLIIILPIRYFLIQPFYVKGASMEPNFYDHEYLIIDEISYRFSEPKRGDIVVFKYPRDPRQFFIKRVIGLPGETVEISYVVKPRVPVHMTLPPAIVYYENEFGEQEAKFSNLVSLDVRQPERKIEAFIVIFVSPKI